MTGRTALVLMTSTLHHRDGATSTAVLERQRRLLAATGHERVVLLGGERVAGDWAGTGAEAAALLSDAQRVTVLGHATIATEAALARLVATDGIATHAEGEGWERIDSADGWAGVMRGPGRLVRNTLAELGDWDAQATLVRRAVQAGLPRVRVGEGATACAFDVAACDALLSGERAGRLAGASAALTERGQAWADRLARWVDRRTVRAALVAMLVAAVLCLALVGAALAGWTPAVALLLPATALVGGVAASAARLNRRVPWPGPGIALAGLATAPPVLAWTGAADGPMLSATWASALLAGALLSGQGAKWLRLDLVALALSAGLLLAGPVPTVAFAAPALLLTALISPANRRRLRTSWRRWQD